MGEDVGADLRFALPRLVVSRGELRERSDTSAHKHEFLAGMPASGGGGERAVEIDLGGTQVLL